MNTYLYMAETTRDKVVLASVMEHQLIKLLKEIEEDSKMDTHIQKIFDIQITLMKRWAETPTHAATSIPKKPKRHKFKVAHLSEDDTRDFITCKLGALKRKTVNLPQERVDVGYGNTYVMHTVKEVNAQTPFDVLLFDKRTKQIIIRLGNESKSRIVNARLSNVYKQTEDNSRSIICNNNISEKNLYCYNTACKYYHDPYLGYLSNMHQDRQFASCPIVFNCQDFKSGAGVKKNIQAVEWTDSITLYQSSLCNLLIACLHSCL